MYKYSRKIHVSEKIIHECTGESFSQCAERM
jgi:hypothetical protein